MNYYKQQIGAFQSLTNADPCKDSNLNPALEHKQKDYQWDEFVPEEERREEQQLY